MPRNKTRNAEISGRKRITHVIKPQSPTQRSDNTGRKVCKKEIRIGIVHTSHAPPQRILVFRSAVTQRPRETSVVKCDRSNNFPPDLNL